MFQFVFGSEYFWFLLWFLFSCISFVKPISCFLLNWLNWFIFFLTIHLNYQFERFVTVVVHLVMSDSLWPHGPYSMPGFPVLHCLLEFPQTHIHWIDDSIQPSHPLSPPSPPALSLSQHQSLFQWVSIKWPKYWSFSFSISPSNEYLGLISFRIDWFDLAVLGTLRLSVFSFLVITLKIWKCILRSLTLVSFHFPLKQFRDLKNMLWLQAVPLTMRVVFTMGKLNVVILVSY